MGNGEVKVHVLNDYANVTKCFQSVSVGIPALRQEHFVAHHLYDFFKMPLWFSNLKTIMNVKNNAVQSEPNTKR